MREADRIIELLTGWILRDLSAIVPIGTGARMGTGLNGDKGRSFPADFFPNLRKFLFFSSPTYDLRPTTYCLFPLAPNFGPYLSLLKMNLSLLDTILSLTKAILSLPEANLSLNQANLSLPKRHLLSPGGELLLKR
jgi:hypothetical protein